MNARIFSFLIFISLIINKDVFAQQYETLVFEEQFDDNTFQNNGWEITSNSDKTWSLKQAVVNPFSNINNLSTTSAICDWSSNSQEEWLISPQVNISNYSNLTLLFYLGINTKWAQQAPLTILVRTSNETDWNSADSIWSSTQAVAVNVNEQWQWQQIELNIETYSSGNMLQLALRYKGKSGDMIAIDDFRLYNNYHYTKAIITSFTVPHQTKESEIDIDEKTVDIEVELDTDLSAVVPTITYDGASVLPASKQPQKFTVDVPVTYTVTAQNPAYKTEWDVTIHYLDYEANIIDFVLEQQVEPAVINQSRKTVEITVAYGTDLDNLSPQITVSDGATIDFANNENGIFEDGKQVLYEVTPYDPQASSQIWKVTVNVQEVKDGTEILSFSLPSQVNPAIIDSLNRTVKVEVSCDTKLDTITPQIEISDEAVITAVTEGDFVDGEAFTYQVKASNPEIEPAMWKITIAKQDYLTNIYSFDLPVEVQDIAIDTTNHVITVAVDNANLLNNISPSIEVAPCATIEPAPSVPQNFEIGKPFYYTVYPADPNADAVKWKVLFSIAILKERFDNEIFPPDGWQLYTFNTTNTWEKNVFDIQPFTTQKPTNKYSAVCSWSSEEQNEQLVSKELKTNGLSNLTLVFWAAFSKNYINNSPLELVVITENDERHKLWQSAASMQSGLTPQWIRIQLDLSEFIGQTIRLAFVYSGSNGNTVAIDDILLSEIVATDYNKRIMGYNISVFPNPAIHNLTIKTDKQLQQNTTLEIFDIQGARQWIKKISGTNEIKINTGHLPAGIYMLKIRNTTHCYTTKFVIEKQ